ELTASDAARWKIVMHHRPTYSSATAHGSDLALRAVLAPLFDKHKVDFVFSGHDHDYERSKPMLGNVEQTNGTGTVYIVDGGLGAELYTVQGDTFTAKMEKTHSAFAMRIRRDMADAVVFHPDGSMVDSFSKTKPAPP